MDEQLDYEIEGNSPVVKIKVIGVGGGGNNAVNRMINAKLSGIDFIAINTDKSVLLVNKAPMRLQIGEKLTKGHGAGNDPSVGERAAEESKASIVKVLQDADLVFVTAGMGGGTGTGAAPVVARIAREMGILTVGVVTKPFEFEGDKRMVNAERGIENLRKYVDIIMVIPNEKLLQLLPEKSSVVENYMFADEALRQGIKGISDTILKTDYINLDFADVKKVIKGSNSADVGKRAHMGIGRSKGDNKIFQALQQAVSSPLLETSIEGAEKLLINFRCGTGLPLSEIAKAAKLVKDVVSKDCEIIYGNGIDEDLGEEVEITLIATGLKDNRIQEQNDIVNQPYYKVSEEAEHNVDRERKEFANRLFETQKMPKQEEVKKETLFNENQTIITDDEDDEDDIPPFLKKIRKN